MKLPNFLKIYFWDCDFKVLSLEKHHEFITTRLMNFGDLKAIKWLIKHSTKRDLKRVVDNSRGLETKSYNFWKKMLL